MDETTKETKEIIVATISYTIGTKSPRIGKIESEVTVWGTIYSAELKSSYIGNYGGDGIA